MQDLNTSLDEQRQSDVFADASMMELPVHVFHHEARVVNPPDLHGNSLLKEK